jgi:hypothetical protein
VAKRLRLEEDHAMAKKGELKELVAVAVKLQALDKTIEHLRARVDAGANSRAVRYAALAAILDTSELMASLVRLAIAAESEESE